MAFIDILNKYNWNHTTESIYSKTSQDVEHALGKKKRDLEDFKALISPAAGPYLEQMAVLSNQYTQRRFGKTIQLYIPLYLSNVCDNHCIYCGFNHENDIQRVILSDEQILKEVEIIKSYGYEHILIVTGESPKAGFEYLRNAVKLVKPYFSLISMEVQPLKQEEYKQLIDEGLNTIYVYQETYNKENYKKYHPKGRKSDFEYRLDTTERLGKEEIHKIGIGFLNGLEEWRTEAFYTALHLSYLEKTYWKTKYSISFPRLRPHEGSFIPKYLMNDKELTQLICAYRLFNEEVEMSITVRESQKFRDNILKLGITSMSAGSKTQPGGYAEEQISNLEQFSVYDNRTPTQIVEMIKQKGYEAVWKDWDKIMQ